MEVLKTVLLWGSKMAIGLGLLSLINNAFDLVAYPLAMCWAGPLLGGSVMAIASVPFNYLLIKLYDLFGQDLMGIEQLKKVENVESESRLRSWLYRLTGKSRIGRFIVISLYDPLPATLYMRNGFGEFNGLRGQDWKWFALSTLIANIAWGAMMAIGVTSFEYATGVCG